MLVCKLLLLLPLLLLQPLLLLLSLLSLEGPLFCLFAFQGIGSGPTLYHHCSDARPHRHELGFSSPHLVVHLCRVLYLMLALLNVRTLSASLQQHQVVVVRAP